MLIWKVDSLQMFFSAELLGEQTELIAGLQAQIVEGFYP
jgi:hypothetical protein